MRKKRSIAKRGKDENPKTDKQRKFSNYADIFKDRKEEHCIIYIRPISCNKPVKYKSTFHREKYKEDRILFGRFIT